MKRFTKLSCLLVLALLIFGMNQAEAQRSKKRSRSSKNDEYFDESGNFAHKLWYGGGFVLNFYSTAFNGTRGNVFEVGVSPMVGYKILPNVSVGPRVEFSFINARFNSRGGVAKFSGVTYGIGPFARFKPFEQLFAQVEFQYLNTPLATNQINGDKIVTVRNSEENFFIGAGYTNSAGSLFGYEIMILYNVLEADDTIDLPISFRFGVTYNF